MAASVASREDLERQRRVVTTVAPSQRSQVLFARRTSLGQAVVDNPEIAQVRIVVYEDLGLDRQGLAIGRPLDGGPTRRDQDAGGVARVRQRERPGDVLAWPRARRRRAERL